MNEEKRRTQRFQLEAPVMLPTGNGALQNISESGIYFLTDQNLVKGNIVNFTLQLDFACPGKPLHLNCRGQVLRVELADNKYGVAASLSECWCVN